MTWPEKPSTGWLVARAYAVVIGLDIAVRLAGVSFEPVMPAVVAGLAVAGRDAGVTRSSWRHRSALAASYVMGAGAPLLAVGLLPAAHRHDWPVATPIAFVASLAGVGVYGALVRRPGFGPPPTVETPPVPRWTDGERHELLPAPTRVTFQRAYPIALALCFFALLTVVAGGIAAGAFASGDPLAGAVAAMAGALLLWSTVRLPQVTVRVDAGGITVRNILRSHRIDWSDVRRIVPAREDVWDSVRIERFSGRPVRCTAISAGLLEPARRLDGEAGALAALLGPPAAAPPAGSA